MKTPPPHYSVIICIEYLLAIVEIVKKVVVARAFQKRKTRNQALPYGGSCFIEGGNIYSDRVPISLGCPSEDVNFIFL